MPPPGGGENFDERTESATQYRRDEFRRQGIVAISRELLGASVLLACGVSLFAFSGQFLTEFALVVRKCFGFTSGFELGKKEWLDLSQFILTRCIWMVAPILSVACLAGAAVCTAQVGWHVTFEPLSPNWDRINFVSGFRRVFSAKGFVEALKAVLKMVLVTIVIWFFFRGELGSFTHYFQMDLNQSTPLLFSLAGRMLIITVSAFLVLGGADYFYQRFQHEKQMRMTKREAREEFKLREGDPLIKARIKSVQRKMASRRMMEAVPKSDVVITNPTHYAIALQYDAAEMHAPKVVAKGAGAVAQKIKEVARFNKVPCVENKPLARTLFKELDINEYIPRHLFKAVAEVLAYVYRLKGRLAHG